MKASELTIGAIISFNGEPRRIRTLTRRKVGHCSLKNPVVELSKIADCEPILIEKEHLLSNGFTDVSDNNGQMVYRYIDDTYVALLWTDNGIRFRTEDENLATKSQAYIKYVHQLQSMLNISGIEWEVNI